MRHTFFFTRTRIKYFLILAIVSFSFQAHSQSFHFRSKGLGGNWATLATWEYSIDSVNWSAATATQGTPGSAANNTLSVRILTGTSVAIAGNVTNAITGSWIVVQGALTGTGNINFACKALDNQNTINLTGGTLTISGTPFSILSTGTPSQTTFNGLTISGATASTTIKIPFTTNGALSVNTAGGSFTVNTAATSATLKGNLTATGNFIADVPVTFSGTAQQTLAGANATFNKDVTVSNTSATNGLVGTGSPTFKANLINSNSKIGFTGGTATFNGGSPQLISGTGTPTTKFFNLSISSSVVVDPTIEVPSGLGFQIAGTSLAVSGTFTSNALVTFNRAGATTLTGTGAVFNDDVIVGSTSVNTTLNGAGSFVMNGNLTCNGATSAVTFTTPSVATFGGSTNISTDQSAGKTLTFFNVTLSGDVTLDAPTSNIVTFTVSGAGALGLNSGTFKLNGGKLNVSTGVITTGIGVIDATTNTTTNSITIGATGAGTIAFAPGSVLNTFSVGRTMTCNDVTVTNLSMSAGTLTNTGALTIANGGSVTSTGGKLITSSGSISTVSPSDVYDLTYNIAGALTTGDELSTSATAINNFTKSGAQVLTLNKDLTVNNTFTLSAGTLTAGVLSGGTYPFAVTLNGVSNTISNTAAANLGVLNIDGGSLNQTSTGTITVKGNINLTNVGAINFTSGAATFNNNTTITNTGSGTISFNTLNVSTTSGALTTSVPFSVAGIFTVTNPGTFTANSGADIILASDLAGTGAFTSNALVTFNGTTTISNTGTKTFTDVTVSNSPVSHTVNVTANVTSTISGNLVNNGTLNCTNGTWIFTGSAASISGTPTTTNFFNLTITGTLTNYVPLTVGTALAGSGKLTQGVITPNPTLNLGGTSAITSLDASTNPNTVNYTGTTTPNQTVKAVAYQNLTLSSTGTATLQVGTTSILGNLTLGGTVATTGVIGLTISGDVVIGTSTSFTAGAFTHNVGGNWTGNGTFDGTGSTINFNKLGVQSINGNATTFNNLTLSGSGTKTFGFAAVIQATLAIGSGASADLGSFVHTANKLTLGGAIQLAGNWGGVNNSGSSPQIDVTYFPASTTGYVAVAANTFFSRANTDWNTPSTWSNIGIGGTQASSVPTSADDVVIGGGNTVTLSSGNTTPSCKSLSFNAGNGETNSLTISSGFTLGVVGAVTLPQTVASGSNTLIVGAGSLTAASVSFTNTTGGAGTPQMTIGTGTVTISGDVTSAGSANITFTGAGTLQLGKNLYTSANGTLTSFSGGTGSTVEYNGAAQTVQTFTYQNLTFSGSGVKTAVGNSTINGDLVIHDNTDFTVGAFTLAVGKTTTIGDGASGFLTINSATGTKTFTGLVTVNNGGTWRNTANENVTIQGGITNNNGTFTAGNGTYTFGASQALSGSGALNFTNVTVSTAGVTVTNNNSNSSGVQVSGTLTITGATVSLVNNRTLTVGTALSGTGKLTQGSNTPNPTLNLGGTSTITTLDASTNPNTVNYTGSGQTVHTGNYNNLTLSGSGTAALPNTATAITGDLTLSGSASATANQALTITGNVSIGTGLFTAGAFTHFIGGNWTSNGTFDGTGSTFIFNGTTQAVTGSNNFNNLQINSSVSFTAPSGAMSVGGSFTNTSPSFLHNNGTINFNGSTQAVTGAINFNNLQINSSTSFTAPSATMGIAGSFTNNTPSFLHNNGTVNFNGGTQAVTGGVSFNNLQINSSTSFTAPSATMSIAGDFTNNSSSFLHNNGTVSFNGVSLQHIQGSGITTFNNINVSNSTPSVSVTLESSQNLLGVLTLSAGAIFDADGSTNSSVFTLLSSADKPAIDASIASIPSTASVTGAVTVQRYFGAADDVDRFISSPVSSATVAQLQQAVPITGSFTGTSYPCTGCLSNGASLKWYNESASGSFVSRYTGYPTSSNASTLVPGVGYDMWMWNGVAPSTINFRGPVNQGTIAFKNQTGGSLSYTNSGTPSADGWNLIGNPYPSAIQWNNTGWSRGSNIDPTIWLWDDIGKVWHSYNANTAIGDLTNGVIASGQAFWVYVSGASSGLTITENAKSSAGNGSYYRKEGSEIQPLTISLNYGEISENSYLIPKSKALGNGNKSLKPTIGTETLSIAIIDNNNKYGHYALRGDEESIPLFIYGKTDGEYSISFNFEESTNVFDGFYLVDLELKVSTKVLHENKYVFNLSASQRFNSENRFVLTKKPDLILNELAEVLKCYPNPTVEYVNIEVSSEDVKEFVLMSNSGIIITPITFANSGGESRAKVSTEALPSGLYFIKGLVNGKVMVEKIIKYK